MANKLDFTVGLHVTAAALVLANAGAYLHNQLSPSPSVIQDVNGSSPSIRLAATAATASREAETTGLGPRPQETVARGLGVRPKRAQVLVAQNSTSAQAGSVTASNSVFPVGGAVTAETSADGASFGAPMRREEHRGGRPEAKNLSEGVNGGNGGATDQQDDIPFFQPGGPGEGFPGNGGPGGGPDGGPGGGFPGGPGGPPPDEGG